MTLVDVAPKCALAVYAHPDDGDVSCGGTLARWAAAGTSVEVVVCSAGDKGSLDPGTLPVALASRRAKEVDAASAVLGIAAVHRFEIADGELANAPSLRGRLVALLRHLRPQVVVCPDPTAVFFGAAYVNHRDHREVGWATLDTVAHEAGNPHYWPDAGPAHAVSELWMSGSLSADAWVDIGKFIEVKARALGCHGSQLGGAAEWLRTAVMQRAEEAGRQAGVAHAEGFRRLILHQ